MKAMSFAGRYGIALIGVLALLSCSEAVLDQANEAPAEAPAEVASAPAGAPEPAPEPETPDGTPTANPPSAVEPDTPTNTNPNPPIPSPRGRHPHPGVHGCSSCNRALPTNTGPMITVAAATVTVTTYVNQQPEEVTRSVVRFTRTGDDLTKRLVITFTNQIGGDTWKFIIGFSPGAATFDYPSRGMGTGVHMAVELDPWTDLYGYIDEGKTAEDGYRPYQIGDPPGTLAITGQ